MCNNKNCATNSEDARVLMHEDESSALQDEALFTAATNEAGHSTEMNKGTPRGAQARDRARSQIAPEYNLPLVGCSTLGIP